MGKLLSQLSPSRRVDILNPMKNKDDGASGLEGSNPNGEFKGSNGAEGTGDAERQTVTSNFGKEIDVTPSATQTTTATNSGYKGEHTWTYGEDGKPIGRQPVK